MYLYFPHLKKFQIFIIICSHSVQRQALYLNKNTGKRSEKMNILFFLTPKSDVAYISEDDTLRQALEKMEHHKYSAVPIVSRTGRYVGTLTEGDLLWGIKNQFNLDLKGAERIPVTAIRRRCDNRPVKADADMEDLIGKALNQNFVPVLDDQKSFIGIITRKDIIKYFYQKCETAEERSRKCQEQGGKEHKKTDLSAVVKLRSQEGVLV